MQGVCMQILAQNCIKIYLPVEKTIFVEYTSMSDKMGSISKIRRKRKL